MPVTHGLLEIQIHAFWHPGTGRGDGASADATVHTDVDGLPVLPGRTVKGLLRAAHALWTTATGADPTHAARIFGSALPGLVDADDRVHKLEAARFSTQAGLLRVESARLGRTAAERRQWADFAAHAARAPQSDARAQLALLKRPLASTKLDDAGVAADETLRTIEVFVPMTLWAPMALHADDGAALLGELREAAALFLRGLGAHRNRGLGRCTATIAEVPNA